MGSTDNANKIYNILESIDFYDSENKNIDDASNIDLDIQSNLSDKLINKKDINEENKNYTDKELNRDNESVNLEKEFEAEKLVF